MYHGEKIAIICKVSIGLIISMKRLMVEYSKNKNYFLIFVLFCNPFIIFINQNIAKFDIFKVKTLFEISLIFLLILILISFLIFSIIKLLKIRIGLIDIFGIVLVINYLFFFHFDFKYQLPFKGYNIEFAMLILFFISPFFIKKIFFSDKNFFKILISIFLFINFIFYSSSILIKKITDKSSLLINSNELIYKKNTNADLQNMYLIINDEATSLDLFDKYYKTEIKEEFLKKISHFNYKYVDDSYSSYNQTELTFASILHLKYIFNDKSPKYQDTKNFYPQILKYDYENLPLIRLLNSINYKFNFIGNTRGNCKNYINKDCIVNEKNRFDQFSSHINMSEIFFLKTPYLAIFNRFYDKIRRFMKIPLYKNNFVNNDAIGKFIKYIDKENYPKKNFFLVHNLYPHLPYSYKADCSERKSERNRVITTKNTNKKDISTGYFNNYLCSLKKIEIFVKFLEKYDKNAVVIFQADHGKYFQIGNKKEKMEIFNLIKGPERCQKYINKEIDNVNAVRFLISCATNIDLDILPKETFWGPYLESDVNWGKLEKLN